MDESRKDAAGSRRKCGPEPLLTLNSVGLGRTHRVWSRASCPKVPQSLRGRWQLNQQLNQPTNPPLLT